MCILYKKQFAIERISKFITASQITRRYNERNSVFLSSLHLRNFVYSNAQLNVFILVLQLPGYGLCKGSTSIKMNLQPSPIESPYGMSSRRDLTWFFHQLQQDHMVNSQQIQKAWTSSAEMASTLLA